ncbi:MAG: hypothetical protein LBQ32_08520 [Burkholderiaceae bacterium]|jgi:hypothetical protein|nr:hypothetical protein [Burkholderiaceae bacterium]
MPKLDPNTFPQLDELLGAWFHQDFNLDSDGSIEDVLGTYRRVSSGDECAAVVRDIDRFLALPGDTLNDEFDQTFKPDIDPAGWGMSAREWLQRVRELLL